jgi:peptidoglycan/xylan/chitin deacetylase (PgdA/CDA1 family)
MESSMILDFICPGIKNIPLQDSKTLYLTFDDGPKESTLRILDVLAACEIEATFFVVASEVERRKAILGEIKSRGHGLGNHSLDHKYGPFFAGRKAMGQWVHSAENLLSFELGEPTVGFRPPAGIRTPELRWALEELNIPLVLWKIRFFDTVMRWTPSRALSSLKKTASGDIILLHDPQPHENLSLFVETLKIYIETAKKMGFEFRKLTRGLCQEAKLAAAKAAQK